MTALFKNLLSLRGIEYLTLNQQLEIVETSIDVHQYADTSDGFVPGKHCCLGLPELFGVEADLESVIQGQRSDFRLSAIARALPDGSHRYFDLYALKHDEGDCNRSLILFLEDVSERMTLEQSLVQGANEMSLLLGALETSKKYVDKIITSMADALIVTTSLGIIKTVNQATQELLEYDRQDLIHQPLSLIIADPNFMPQAIQPSVAFQGRVLRDVEVVCRTKTGEKRSIAFSCSMIQTGLDQTTDFIYIGRDVTEQQRTQQRLMAQYTTSGILSRSPTLTTAVAKLLPAICQSLEWDIVELWMPQEQVTEELPFLPEEFPRCSALGLHCVEIWSRPLSGALKYVKAMRETTFTFGSGLPGQIWKDQSPLWISDVAQADFLPSTISSSYPQGVAVQAGLHAAFGVPIYSNNEVLGVVTFLSREVRQPDPALIQTLMVIGNQLGEFIQRKRAEIALSDQQRQTEHLLCNVLPRSIVDRLKQEQIKLEQPGNQWSGIAEQFDETTVLFADLVGFTQLTVSLSPIELVSLLNEIFSAFDHLSDRYGLEKIKTIGDAYMVVGGVPNRRKDHAQAIAEMALEMQAALAQFNLKNHKEFRMRIGIHSGSVVAGVIGVKKFIYDLWGDTVNTANRMESHGLTGQIQVSATTYQLLKHQYHFTKRGAVSIKSKGEMKTYLLTGRQIF
ncbi:adenylate/guanylate cyclase domain-containing protein [Phormidesmis sp. 146-12]